MEILLPYDYLFLAKRLIKKLFHLHQALLSVNHQKQFILLRTAYDPYR